MFLKNTSNSEETKLPKVEPWKIKHFFQNALNTLTRVLSNHISILPGALINHLSSFNNNLSITLVSNKGIISKDFFENSTTNKKHTLKLNNVNMLQYKFSRSYIGSFITNDINFIMNQTKENESVCNKNEILLDSKQGESKNLNASKHDSQLNSPLKSEILKEIKTVKIRRKSNYISKSRKFIQTKFQLKRYGQIKRRRKLNQHQKHIHPENKKRVDIKITKFKKKIIKKRINHSRAISECSTDSEDNFIVFEEESECEKKSQNKVLNK